MLRACLLDKESQQVICVANTHLKAKVGSKNDAIREHQVRKAPHMLLVFASCRERWYDPRCGNSTLENKGAYPSQTLLGLLCILPWPYQRRLNHSSHCCQSLHASNVCMNLFLDRCS